MPYEQLKLENQVCFRFYTVARLIVQGYQPWLSKMGLTYTQYLVLMILWERDGQPVNDIAKRLLLETNTVTPLVKRLAEAGIVQRVKDKDDARRTLVYLTEKGKELEAEAAKVPGCMGQMLTEKGLKPELFLDIIPALDEIIPRMTYHE